MSNEYIPGVCNIGPAEIRRRRLVGIVGAVAALALFVLLTALEFHPVWRLLVFLPATAAASGFLQAAQKFCTGFSMAGISNMQESLGNFKRIENADDRKKDRARGMQLMGLSIVIGAAIGLLAWLLPV